MHNLLQDTYKINIYAVTSEWERKKKIQKLPQSPKPFVSMTLILLRQSNHYNFLYLLQDYRHCTGKNKVKLYVAYITTKL